MRKNLEKAIVKRTRRAKVVLEKQQKAATDLAKLLYPWEEERRKRVQRDVQSNIQQEKNWTLGFQQRLGAGERRWTEVEAEITRTQGGHANIAQEHLKSLTNMQIPAPVAPLSPQFSGDCLPASRTPSLTPTSKDDSTEVKGLADASKP